MFKVQQGLQQVDICLFNHLTINSACACAIRKLYKENFLWMHHQNQIL